MANPHKAAKVSRRTLLSGTAALLPLVATSCSSTSTNDRVIATNAVFTAQERATLRAVVDRLIPADEFSPAASECGVLDYFERCLNEWNQGDLPLLRSSLAALETEAQKQGGDFAALDASAQDALLEAMEAGQFPQADAQAGFNRLLRLTLEGMFSDPYYGGNRNYVGWDLIGYPGVMLATTAEMQVMDRRLPPLHTSAYGAEHDGH